MTEICQKFNKMVLVFEEHFRNGGDFSNLHLEPSFTPRGKRRVRQTAENALESLLPAAKRDLGSPMDKAEGEAWAIEKLIFRLTHPTLRTDLLTHAEDLFAIVVVSEKGDPSIVWKEWGASTLLAAAANPLRMNSFLKFLYPPALKATVGRALSWAPASHQALVQKGLEPDEILNETLLRAAQNADLKITESVFFYPRKLVNKGKTFVKSEEINKNHILPKQKIDRDISAFFDRTDVASVENLEEMLKGTGFTLKSLMFQIVHDGLNPRLYNGLAPDAVTKLQSALQELRTLTEDDPILPLIHRPTRSQPELDEQDGGNTARTQRIEAQARDLATGEQAADPGAATSTPSEKLALLALELVKGHGEFTDTADLGSDIWWQNWYHAAISSEPELEPSFLSLATRGIALIYVTRAGLAVLRGPGTLQEKALDLNATSVIGTSGAHLALTTMKWAVENNIGQGDEMILADAALRVLTHYRQSRAKKKPD
jgi:hypothetical protein